MNNKSIQFLKGVGEKRAEMLKKKGISTVEDMLYFFPRAHEDRTEIKEIADKHNRFFACQRYSDKAEHDDFVNDCV